MAGPSAAGVSPRFFETLRVEPAARPRLFVVVDTEEEFDWDAPFSREAVGVSAIDEVGRLQTVLSRYRLTPTYVIDYPVAATASSSGRLRDLAADGHCQIGAHLHPWVSPPFDEPVSSRMSYGCNLGAPLEREKIRRLQAAIEQNLGLTPRSFKAGRYGFAATTADTLEALGFDLDLSVNPHMDFSADDGPSFLGFSSEPGWFGRARRLLELPCTHGFVGLARRSGEALHGLASAPWLRRLRAVGVLAKTGTLNRVMLSPENSTTGEMKALTQALYVDGVRTFSLTLHSPSLKPGCTPYVRTVAERDAFLGSIDNYCEDFFGRFNGVPSTPVDFYDEVRGAA